MANALATAYRMRSAVSNGSSFKPVEPGVTGKEKLFQESRNFGPGPISPYPPKANPERRPRGRGRRYYPVYTGRPRYRGTVS